MNQHDNRADDANGTRNRSPLSHDVLRELMASGEPWRNGSIEWLLDWIETRREEDRR